MQDIPEGKQLAASLALASIGMLVILVLCVLFMFGVDIFGVG